MIYLDNAATTLRKPPSVAAAVVEAMENCGNSGRGAHAESLAASRTVYGVRAKLASLFHCRPERVCFTPNATMALNTAVCGLLTPGDHAISTDWEHNSVLRPLFRLREQGMGLSFLPADRRGRLNYDALEGLLRPNTRAVVCTHASNLTGDMADVARLADFTHRHGLLLILDASQTAGVLTPDMAAQGVDVLCFTGHKGLMGPQGTGGLCVGEGVDIRPFAVGGTGVQSRLEAQPPEYPTRLEAGTLNSHGLAGLGAALDFLAQTQDVGHREMALARRFYRAVRQLPGVTVYGDFTAALRAPIVTLNIGKLDTAAAADALAQRFDIAVRAGLHCAPRLHAALDTLERGALRFSWGYYNTEAETDAAAAAVAALAAGR